MRVVRAVRVASGERQQRVGERALLGLEEPRGARRNQEEPGGARRGQDLGLKAISFQTLRRPPSQTAFNSTQLD